MADEPNGESQALQDLRAALTNLDFCIGAYLAHDPDARAEWAEYRKFSQQFGTINRQPQHRTAGDAIVWGHKFQLIYDEHGYVIRGGSIDRFDSDPNYDLFEAKSESEGQDIFTNVDIDPNSFNHDVDRAIVKGYEY